MAILKWLSGILLVISLGLLIALTVVLVIDNRSHNPATTLAPLIRLNNGMLVPVLGLGTFDMHLDEARNAIMDAIDRGYRHIDGAWLYRNEVEIGEAINLKIAEGVVRREELFVVNKLWSVHHDPIHVRGALETSLRNMNLDYVDLYLIHWPISFEYSEDSFPVDEDGNPLYADVDILDTWRELEMLVDDGLVKAIGVSNFNTSQLDNIIDNARIQPVMNQFEVHSHCLNKRLIEHCRRGNVAVTGYAPLGAPGREVQSPDERFVIDEPVIRQIAMKHQKTPAQVLIRYQFQLGIVTIPKSATRDRIITNFNVFDFHLDADDIAGIEGIDYYFRTVANLQNAEHYNYPFHDECV